MDARRAAVFLLVGLGFAALPAFGMPPYFESLLYLVFFWIALATSWSLLSGFSGYFSFGHGAFYGTGVYTTAFFATRYDVPFVTTLLIAGALSALLGTTVGAAVFRVRRLRGELFALLTLAITFIVASLVLNTSIDGGPGIFLRGISVPKIYASDGSTIYVFGVGVGFASLMTARAVQYSSLGRGLFAIHDDEDVAEVTGVPTFWFKLAALALSSFLAGVAGGIHAVYVTYVTVAETFSIDVPLFVILMSVLGGARHWLGPALGATLVTLLSYAFVSGESAIASRAVVGLIMIIVILFLPRGVMGFITVRWALYEPLVRRWLSNGFRRLPATTWHPFDELPRRWFSHDLQFTAMRCCRRLLQPLPLPQKLRDDGTVVQDQSIRIACQPVRSMARGVLLHCDDVHLSFRGVKALDGVSLDLREGEILGLVGPNGSGKSTLVNAISGYYRPQSGRVLFAQEDLIGREGHRIARLGIARTHQIPRPFPFLSVVENVALAATFGAAALDGMKAYGEATHWLEFVGLADRRAALPSQLNLHQRKFLELARALASRPRLVLLDEVLTGLTPSEIRSATALVRQIRQRGTTIVFIEHNMRVVLELVDRLVVLNYGKVIAQGNPRQVMQERDVVDAYLGTANV
jgi:branched-chain amino acid transport system permease protein